MSRPNIPTPLRRKMEEMHGYNLHLVIQRQLLDTDLNEDEPRLRLPIIRILFDFTTRKERRLLSNQGTMEVKILDEGLRESTILLAKCRIESQDHYCLTTHWKSFVLANGLKCGQTVQLWTFRTIRLLDPLTEEFAFDLHFALNKLNA